jgi:hypothetical protein
MALKTSALVLSPSRRHRAGERQVSAAAFEANRPLMGDTSRPEVRGIARAVREGGRHRAATGSMLDRPGPLTPLAAMRACTGYPAFMHEYWIDDITARTGQARAEGFDAGLDSVLAERPRTGWPSGS